MKNQKYKNKGLNRVIFCAILVCTFIFIFLIAVLVINKHNSEEYNLSYNSLTTVKQVIEYHKSKYISEKESEDPAFYLDINLELKVLPYDEDDKSNEDYYNALLNDVAKVIKYNSYRMFDEKNDITIEVLCKNDEIESIIINGIEDYFIYMDLQTSMKSYEEIPITNLNISSEKLKECKNNNWNSLIDFGTRESTFNQYNIYFDEGIFVRNIQSKIYNIIFTRNYSGSVIDNIYPGMNLDDVKDILGKPSFEDEELNVIGYKGNDIYAFFTNDVISIYAIKDDYYGTEQFLDLYEYYLDGDDSDLLEFMNQLTYTWPDYSEYNYSSNYVFIAYPLKGIEIKVNYDDTNGILVYNNIKGDINSIEPYLKNSDFISRLKIDCVFEAEKRRITEEKDLIEKSKDYINNIQDNEKNTKNESLVYNILPEMDSNNGIYCIKFISKTGEKPNRELFDGINDYIWISNEYFLYSKIGKGIFLYNLENGNVQRIIEGKDDYKFESYNNGILTYDNGKTIELR